MRGEANDGQILERREGSEYDPDGFIFEGESLCKSVCGSFQCGVCRAASCWELHSDRPRINLDVHGGRHTLLDCHAVRIRDVNRLLPRLRSGCRP